MISEERLWQLWDASYDDQRDEWYTIKFAAAVAREARREAIEECATVARAYEPRCDVCPSGVENAIRALEDE